MPAEVKAGGKPSRKAMPSDDGDMLGDGLYHGVPRVWDGERHIIFSPYAAKIAKVSPEAIGSEETRDQLALEGFFGTPERPKRSRTSADVALIVTTECNLQCTYCYVVGSAERRRMTPDHAVRIIREKVSQGARRLSVAFFGGEPTLNMACVRAAVDYSDKLGLPRRFIINSNGVVDNAELEFLIEHDFIFSISSDGRPDLTDANRVRVGKQGVGREVECALRRLVEAGVLLQVRATVTSGNAAALAESIGYWDSLGIRFVHFEPAYSVHRPELRPGAKEYVAAVVNALDEAEKRGMWMISSPFMNLLTPSTYFCTSVAGEKQIYTPDGGVSTCYRVQEKASTMSQFLVGAHDQASDLFVESHAVCEQMRRIRVQSKQPCRTCHARYICAGGCPYRNLIETGSLTGIDPWSCFVKRELVRDAVLRTAKALETQTQAVVFGQAVFEGLAEEKFA